jgi:DNA-binding NarL/FixJ family response regulator
MLTAYPDTKSIKDAEALDVSCYIPKASGYSDTEKALKSALEMLDKRRADGR